MRDYFCGWYFKCQSDAQTLAVIPAIHKMGDRETCSVQVIAEEGTWNVGVSYEHFHKRKDEFRILMGDSYFGEDGIHLCLHTTGFSAVGTVYFGELSPIRYDIMGPFRYVPFLECRHSIQSMQHSVSGALCINGVDYCFRDAVGYIEGDRGCSFPKEYAWTQCCFEGGSLMLSVADIPIGTFHFTGVIGVVLWQGREYRLATYLGARVVRLKNGEIVIAQGNKVLSVKLIEKHARPLLAPVHGSMNRTIHESVACRVSYCFRQGEHTLFSFETPCASFEYEYPD